MSRTRRLDLAFQITVILKGIDGLLEVIGGAILLFVSQATLHGLIASAIAYDLASDDRHAFITNSLTHLDHSLTTGSELFVAIYLLAHGIIKVVLVIALIKRQYHFYPLAIAFFIAFIAYQAYLTGYSHSIASGLLTLFDCLLVALTYWEYRRHRNESQPTAPKLTTKA
jgi:uncharacterized membrane protein